MDALKMQELLHQLCGASSSELSSIAKFAQAELNSRGDWDVSRVESRRGMGASLVRIPAAGSHDVRRKLAA